MLTEDQTICGINVKAGDSFLIDIKAVHCNPEEYIEPKKFIPERFNPESPYYLTPGGTKRHPMSFSPFLGGKRVCIGKTFAESLTKISGPSLIQNFDFIFVNQEHKKNKVTNHLLNNFEPEVYVEVKEASKF
jgi:cytochrome P450